MLFANHRPAGNWNWKFDRGIWNIPMLKECESDPRNAIRYGVHHYYFNFAKLRSDPSNEGIGASEKVGGVVKVANWHAYDE